MLELNRRQFLTRTACSAAAIGFYSRHLWGLDAIGDVAPDLVVTGAKVFTVDERFPAAEAFAVRDGKFLAVGSTQEIRALAGKNTRVLDAAGQTVVPGFIDAHTHPASAGISELRKVDCNRQTIAEIQAAMRKRAEETKPGRWVLGFKYDDTKLKDGRPLSRADLDAVIPDHPAEVLHRGGHTAIYNSLAFKLAGVTRETADPPGGQFGRDANGELTGFVAEKAREVFEKVAPLPPVSRGERQAGVKLVSELMSAAGLTSVHDAITTEDNFTAYEDALAADQMRFRVYAMVDRDLFLKMKAARIRTGFGDERLRIGGLKLLSDGSCSERTMRMSTPYADRPDFYGILTMTQDELNETIEDAHTHQFQVGVHANGDVAIDMVLKAYERVQELHPRKDARHRIEHCTLINDDLLKRIAALGVIPTPFYTYVYFHGDKWGAYGQEKLQSMFAHRSFLDRGIRVAGASDYVPGPFEPLMALQSLVTRRDYAGREWGPNQKITVDEALRVCTLNGAHASFEEHLKGSITPGKLADFVMLAADPYTVDPGTLKDIRVERTVLGGKTVYERT